MSLTLIFANMLFYIYVSLLIIISVYCEVHDLPSYFPRCYIDDPQLNECILNATRILKPQVIKGIKEIKLPSFDPLVISSIYGSQHQDNVRYNASFTNCVIRGFENYEFDEIKYNPTTLTLCGKVRVHTIRYESNYEIVGFLFYFPIMGSGFIEEKYGSINGAFEVKGILKKRKGQEYYFPNSTKVRLKFKGFNMYLSGLFDGNRKLGYLTNVLVSIHGQEIIDAVTPGFEIMVEGFLMGFMKTLTRLIPYNKLFPHS